MVTRYLINALYILFLGAIGAVVLLSKGNVEAALIVFTVMWVIPILYMMDKVIVLLTGLYIDEDDEENNS